MAPVFFAKYEEETRRVDVSEELTSLEDIYQVIREKFDNKPELTAELELASQDPEYNTPYTIANVGDILDGTVVTVRIKKLAAADRKRKLEAAQSNASEIFSAPVKKFKAAGEPRFVVRCRGLPWECTKQQLIEFFEGCTVLEQKILYLPNGRSTGEAIVEVDTEEDYNAALAKNRGHIGRRYIEIFKSTGEDMDRALGVNQQSSTGPHNASSHVVRLRGLPYSALKADILEFFSPLVPSGSEEGIHIVRDKDIGRPSGIAYAEFDTEEDLNTALGMNRKNMGARYIEVFGSNHSELARAMGSGGGPGPGVGEMGGMGSGTTTCLHLRGLPYACTEVEMTKFFQEAGVTPVRIHRKADGAEAYVEFASPTDTDRAMTRNRCYIKHRYIELFRVSYAEVARTVGLGFAPNPGMNSVHFPPEPQGSGGWGGMQPPMSSHMMYGEPRPYY